MNSARPRNLRAFTMIEALAAAALLGIGIAMVVGGFGALSKAEARSRTREVMQRLAIDKYEELIATGETTAGESGDFSDRNINGYSWSSDVQASGTTDLNIFTVSVTPTNSSNSSDKETIDGLLYTPSTTTTTSTSSTQ